LSNQGEVLNRRGWTPSIALGVLLGFSPLLHAQSLADAAEKERQRRRAIGGAGPVYTNDDLPLTKGSLANDAKAKAPQAAADATPAGDPAPPEATEASWRQRAQAATARVTRAEARVADLKNRTSPYRVGRGPGAEDRIARAEDELAKARQALDDLLEAARRAGVPPGWLRS